MSYGDWRQWRRRALKRVEAGGLVQVAVGCRDCVDAERPCPECTPKQVAVIHEILLVLGPGYGVKDSTHEELALGAAAR